MEKKSQFIIIGLIGLSLIFVFLFVSTLSSKQSVMNERDELLKENDTLNTKIERLSKDVQERQGQVSSLTRQLEQVGSDRDELQAKFELVSRAKDDLMDKMKTLQKQMREEPQQAALPPSSQSEDAYWATVLKAKADLEMQLASVRSEIKTFQINNEQLQREKGILELAISNLERDSADMQREMEYKQKIMDSIAQELVMERSDKLKIQSTIKTLKNENAALTRQIKTVNSHKMDLERKLKAVQDDKVVAQTRVSDMEGMLGARLAQINELKDQVEAIRAGLPLPEPQEALERGSAVELPPIVVHPQIEAASGDTRATPDSGKVVAVNRENNFVIVDLGENVGTKVADIFQIYRQGEWVASVEVIKVSKTVSACDIRKEGVPVKIGDTVR